MKTTASASLFAANVSAPAANNGVSGSAAVTGGTAAAGLAHAFLNAATLANYSGGFANSLTANISAGGTTINGVVPTVEINTLGDILQTCVNGVTGNAGCTSLFGFTPSISGVAPTNTLQAMINLARNPYPSAAAMNATTGLLSLTSGSPAFLPVLSATPPDWSLAIVYKSAAVFSTSDYFIGMDGNDTVYAGTNATSAKIAGGKRLWDSAPLPSLPSGPERLPARSHRMPSAISGSPTMPPSWRNTPPRPEPSPIPTPTPAATSTA